MKMQEKKLKRFNVYSKIANVFFILILIFGIIGLSVATGGAVYMASIDFDLADAANRVMAYALPDANLMLPDNFEIPISIVFFIIIHIALTIALTAYIVKSVANIFKNIVHAGTPFISKVSKGLRNMGIALFVFVGITFILNMLMGTVFPHPANMNFDITIDGASLLFGLLLLALGEIFEFGVSLQNDSESIV